MPPSPPHKQDFILFSPDLSFLSPQFENLYYPPPSQVSEDLSFYSLRPLFCLFYHRMLKLFFSLPLALPSFFSKFTYFRPFLSFSYPLPFILNQKFNPFLLDISFLLFYQFKFSCSLPFHSNQLFFYLVFPSFFLSISKCSPLLLN